MRPYRLHLPLLAALSIAPVIAHAQAQLGVTLTDSRYKTLSRADCAADPQETSNFSVSWNAALTTGVQERVYLASSSACDDDAEDIVELRALTTRTTQVGQFPAANSTEELSAATLFGFYDDACGGTEGISKSVYLCVRVYGDDTSKVVSSGQVTFALDSQPPPAPTGVTASALDGGISVSWTASTGATRYAVTVASGATVVKTVEIAGGNTTSTTVSGLVNGTAYTVTVTAYDDAGTDDDAANAATSTGVSATPQLAQGFYDLYTAAGGTAGGGCSAAGGGLGAVIGLLSLLRRRRAAVGTIATGAALAITLGAHEARADNTGFIRSPRRFSLAVKTGNYVPEVDNNLVTTPYATTFGTGGALLWRAQLEYDLWTRMGRVSAGLALGTWRVEGAGRVSSNPALTTEDETNLELTSLTPYLSYRADFLWEQRSIPLVPYVQLGWGVVPWSSSKNGTVSVVNGKEARGVQQGLELTGGLQLVLDAAEPDKAASLDDDFGINSTSLFLEYSRMWWGMGGALNLDGGALSGGLMLAF